MNILLCTPTFDSITHGPSKFAHLLLQINDLYPQHELRILTENVREDIPHQVYLLPIKYPRIVHALGMFLRMISYHRGAKRIRKNYKYDVLIYNNAIHALWSAIWKPKGVKVIGLINDSYYLDTHVRTFNWTKISLINLIHKPFECLAARFLDVIVVNSNYLKNRVEQEYRCEEKKVKRLYKSIEVDKINFVKNRPPITNRVHVLFVKSDYRIGGLDILVAALAKLTDFSFVITVIGALNHKLSEIEQLFAPYPNITLNYLGRQTQPQVFEQMYCQDLLCIPSRTEGLGVANIEGLAAGIPVVSTRVGGIPEVLDSGKNGWLANKESPENLAKNIKKCINSFQERQLKSKRGRQFVETSFSHYKMLETLLNILKK